MSCIDVFVREPRLSFPMAIRTDIVLCNWSNFTLSLPCAMFVVQPGFSVGNDAFDDPVLLLLLLLLALFIEQKHLGIFLRKARGLEAELVYLVGLDVIVDTLETPDSRTWHNGTSGNEDMMKKMKDL